MGSIDLLIIEYYKPVNIAHPMINRSILPVFGEIGYCSLLSLPHYWCQGLFHLIYPVTTILMIHLYTIRCFTHPVIKHGWLENPPFIDDFSSYSIKTWLRGFTCFSIFFHISLWFTVWFSPFVENRPASHV